MKTNFKKILNELSYRVSTGIPDLTNEQHLIKLWDILKEEKWPIEARVELLKNLNELEFKDKAALQKYASKHKIKPDTKVKVGDNETTAGEELPDLKGDEQGEEESTDNKFDKEKVDKIQKELYGEDGKGPLLQESETTQQALDKGYKKGEPWVAPGNAGSNFNENMSNEGSLILEKYPDLTEDELTEILYRKTLGTALGNQQKKTNVESPNKGNKGSIPEDVENKDLYNSARIAARSAKSKNDRANLGKQKAINQVGFGENTKQDNFGGTESDLNRLEDKLKNTKGKIYIYDKETDKVYEIPKDVMVAWVKSSGGGENASDTAVLTEDENGNIIYDGWSDKKGFNDIQANGTLNSDFDKKSNITDKLLETGNIDKETAKQVKNIIKESQDEVKELEKQYKKTGVQLAKTLDSYEGENRKRLLKHLEEQDKKYQEAGTTNHIQDAMKHYGVDNYDDLLKEMSKEGESMSSNRIKIASRLGEAERKYLKNNNQEIPENLQTKNIISDLREKALNVQKKLNERLKKIKGKTKSGKEKPVSDLIGFQEVTDDLHLDKIDTPKDDKDYDTLLKRNTELAMAGTPVTAENIKKCLGVKNTSDAQDNFEVLTEERFTKDRETNKFTTGKVVEIFAIDKEGKKKFIGVKTYRGKNGPDSPTSTTTQWSPNMQKCFDGGKS